MARLETHQTYILTELTSRDLIVLDLALASLKYSRKGESIRDLGQNDSINRLHSLVMGALRG